MPKTVCINSTPPRREIEQFQTHGKDNPCDDQTRPCRPHALRLLVSADTEPTPDQVLNNADRDISSHIVGVVEAPEGQIAHMCRVKNSTEQNPSAQHRATLRCILIQPENPHHAQKQAIHHTSTSTEIIQLFRNRKVARVEDATEQP